MTGATPTGIGPVHLKVLRNLFARGGTTHMSELGGIELDLMARGLIAWGKSRSGSYGASIEITPLGLQALDAVRQSKIEAQRPHHDLGSRLATHLRAKGFFTWENVEFCNPSEARPVAWGTVRPDVFACMPALKARSTLAAIYEVKVSRADFKGDMARPEKRAAYADLAQAVYYCCPEGLIDPKEMPEGFGLLVERSPGSFVLLRKARRQRGFVLATNTALTLMVKRQMPLTDRI